MFEEQNQFLIRLRQTLQRLEDPAEICRFLKQLKSWFVESCDDVDAAWGGSDECFVRDLMRLDFIERRRILERSFLSSYGLFLKLMLSVVSEKLSEAERDECLFPLFQDIDGVASIGSIVNYLAQSQSIEQVNTGVEVLLKVLDSERISSIWRRDVWSDLFPDKPWDKCCEEGVQWLISIPELVTKHQHKAHDSIQSPEFFSRHLLMLLKTVVERRKRNEEKAELSFLGLLMKRLINRGLGNLVVSSLLDYYHNSTKGDEPESFLFLIKSIQDPYSTEKLCFTLVTSLTNEDTRFEILKFFLLEDDQIDDEIGHILFSRILQKIELPLKLCHWLIDILCLDCIRLENMITQLSRIWSNQHSISSTPIPRQSYITALMQLMIPHLQMEKFENSRLYHLLLEGVSNRLGSCLDSIRYQGMRIGQTLASLDPHSEPLFTDLEIDFQSLQPEEQWEEPIESRSCQEGPSSPPKEPSIDSDDDSDFCSSIEDDNLTPMDLREGIKDHFKRGQRPVTLVDLIQDLRSSSDDPKKTISALKQLIPLVKKNSHELESLSVELTRLVVHVVIPDWIHQELEKDDAFDLKGLKTISEVRICCLKSILESVPLQTGEVLGQLFSSSQVTLPQRLEILESMRQASTKLSSPPERLEMEPLDSLLEGGGIGRSKVWGVRSLEVAKKRRETPWRNRFIEVVGSWTTTLLTSAQKVTYGFDLMERDHRVLGSLIITLGTFAESVSQSMTSTTLALVIFPLLKSVIEQKSENCFLRRCVFQTLICVINGLSISRLSNVIGSVLEPVDETDKKLAEIIIWIRTKSEEASQSDQDHTTKILASVCVSVCQKISQKALESTSTKSIEIKLPIKTQFDVRIPSVKWSGN